METIKSFFKRFNQPALVFEVLGYIFVGLGLIFLLIGILACLLGFFSGPSVNFSVILIGLVSTIVAPQFFFAISKVVKAAEKYLEK